MSDNKAELESIDEVLESMHKSAEYKRLKEERFRLLEIASNCSIPGESSSRTIERAIEFKKYTDET